MLSSPVKYGLIRLCLLCVCLLTSAAFAAKADLMIRAAADTTYLGNNVYDQLYQTRTQLVGDYATVVYMIKIQNDGTATDSIRVKGTYPLYRWHAQYFDAIYAGNDITDDIHGGGWTCGPLAPGATKEIRVEVTPEFPGAPELAGIDPYRFSNLITGTAVSDTSVTDTVVAQTRLVRLQPDGLIKAAGTGSYTGDNDYHPALGDFWSTGNEQVVRQTAATGTTLVYHYTVQNDGLTDDTFTVTCLVDDNKLGSNWQSWVLRVYDAPTGGNDITADVTGAGWSTGVLASGASHTFRIEITPAVPSPMLCRVACVAISETASYQSDVVYAEGAKLVSQPDLWVRTAAEAGSYGNNLYEPDNSGDLMQHKALTTPMGVTATYLITVQNDGDQPDNIRLDAPDEQYQGWIIRYYDAASGGTDITTVITGAGWYTGPLSVSGAKVIRVEVTPNAYVSNTTSNVTRITAYSGNATYSPVVNDTATDSVMLITSKTRCVPDGQLKADTETAYIGVNIYKTDVGQTKLLTIAGGGTGVFHLKAQNNGAATDTFIMKGSAGNGTFTVRYYDAETGGSDITAQVVNFGWSTGPLAAGTGRVIRMEVKVYAGASPASKYYGQVTIKAKNELYTWDEIYPTVYTPYAVPTAAQPDMMIRNSSDATLIGNNLYWTEAGQAKIQKVAAGTPASFVLRVQNDGTTDDTFTVKGYGTSGGWGVKYFNLASGGSDITSQVINSGWSTGVLATGAYKELRLEVTPNTNIGSGAEFRVIITATSVKDGSWDQVFAYTYKANYQPDLMLRNSTDSYVGNNVYSTVIGQTKTQVVATGDTGIIYFKLQNDSTLPDSLKLDGNAGYGGWTVKYFDATTGGTDITSAVVAGTWTTGTLAAGATKEIRAEMSPTFSVTDDFWGLLYIYSLNDTSVEDRVRFIANPSVYQADLQIRTVTEYYFGDNIYEKSGQYAGQQSLAATIPSNGAATFFLKVQNDGISPDAFLLTDWRTQSWDCTITYFDAATGGNDITGQITGSGWTTPVLAPGASAEFRVEVAMPYKYNWDYVTPVIRVEAASTRRTGINDVVEAVLHVMPFQPDLLIRYQSNADYIGDDIYGTVTGQTKAYTVAPGVKAVYPVKLQNDGAFADMITLTAAAAPVGWTVKYFDAVSGGKDITAQVTGGGYATGVASYWNAGEVLEGRIEVTPAANITLGSVLNVTLWANSMGDPQTYDLVMASTTAALLYQPDLQIRTSAEASFTGNNVYNTTGASQTKALTTAVNTTATYFYRAQNDGNTADTLKITGPAGSGGWTVQYLEVGTNTDVTAQVTGAGYSKTLAAGAYQDLYVKVTPTSSVTAGAGFNLSLTATSTANTAKKDVVLATTTRQ